MSDLGRADLRSRAPRHRLPDDVLRLQEALLPSSVPLLPHADLAAAYLPAAEAALVGGDWFDAASVPDGRLVMSVGDVVGAGLDAVAVMGQLRAVLAARQFEGGSLVEAVRATELLASRTSRAFACTLCVAALDPLTGVLQYATRGHTAPVLVGADGVRVLHATGDGPIGTRTAERTGSVRLARGDAVLLFTDGLLGADPDGPVHGLERLAEAAARIEPGPGLAPRLVAELPPALHTGQDDAVLLVAQYRDPPAPLHLDFRAEVSRLGHVRAAIDDWAQDVGLAAPDRRTLLIGVSELVANAVEHAYAGVDPGPVLVDATLTQDATVRATVTDQGSWRDPTPDPGDRGRGLSMSASLGMRIEIEVTADGTAAVAEAPARRAVRFLSPPEPRTDDLGHTRLTIVHRDRVTVQVSGPLTTAEHAALLVAEARRVARNGLVPVDVDLRGATALAGPAVAALEELLGVEGPQEVRIVADPGSPVGEALTVSKTPFSAGPGARG